MSSTAHVKGLSKLSALLSQLPGKIKNNIIPGAMAAAAQPVAEQAKQNVSVVSGVMRDGIKVISSVEDGVLTTKIKVTGKHAFAARWVEYGTAAHRIKPKAAKSLFFAGIFAEGIDHPGSSAKPFMRPALDARAGDAVNAAAAHIKKRLNKQGIEAV